MYIYCINVKHIRVVSSFNFYLFMFVLCVTLYYILSGFLLAVEAADPSRAAGCFFQASSK